MISGLDIPGSYNAGRMNNTDIQPFFCIFQNLLSCRGFGFCILSMDKIRRKMVYLCDDFRFRPLRDSMDGTDINHAINPGSIRLTHDIFRSMHINAPYMRVQLRSNRYQSSAVDQSNAVVSVTVKERGKGVLFRDIAFNNINLLWQILSMPGKNKSPNMLATLYKFRNEDGSHMSGSSCYQIQLFHFIAHPQKNPDYPVASIPNIFLPNTDLSFRLYQIFELVKSHA